MNPRAEIRIMGLSAVERRAYRALRRQMDRDKANLAMLGFVLFDRIDIAIYGATYKARILQAALERVQE